MDAVEKYLDEAFKEAFQSVRSNNGGPFGAVIVMDGKVIGRGGNKVTSLHDPTAHAEIVAIRDACRLLKSFDLTGASLYSTCEPCPMCFAAIYWANIQSVYFCSTRHDANEIGFKDNHIYEELNLPQAQRRIPFEQVEHRKATELFTEWKHKSDKTPY